jgi:hypothetical protein
VGYSDAFNAISVNVQDGVVTLGGNALGPVAARIWSHERGGQILTWSFVGSGQYAYVGAKRVILLE